MGKKLINSIWFQNFLGQKKEISRTKTKRKSTFIQSHFSKDFKNELPQIASLCTSKPVSTSIREKNVSDFFKNRQLNQEDLRQCKLYNQSFQSTKQSEGSTILSKLLLQPPSMKQKSEKKLLLLQNRKYEPKFQKPDVQNMIQENINLKNIIQANNHTISTLKIKYSEQEKKIKLLEKGLEKFQKNLFTNTDKVGQRRESSHVEDGQNNAKKLSLNQAKKGAQTSSFQATGFVHSQILKKKIAQLTSINMQAQKEVRFLKKLPNVTIYEQTDIQKQHLMAQAIRLKSIVTSLSQQLQQSTSKENQQKFQNQFMRLMKEENQKLKATVRLLQNDKILLKSRQSIQNKLNSDLKKEIEQLKSKLLYKEAQLEKINNENKNLLFKKTTQFRQEQEQKESQQITDLKTKLSKAESQIAQLQQSNEFYNQQNVSLKEKEKNLTQQITDLENNCDNLVKKLNQEIQQLQFQLNNAKNDYLNLLNAASLRKKKSLALSKQPLFKPRQSRDSMLSGYNSIQEELGLHPANNSNGLAKKEQSIKSLFQSKEAIYTRPVKWEDIQLPLTHLHVALQQKSFITVDSIIKQLEQSSQVRCGQLISVFMEEPFTITKKYATKLARYIVEDQRGGNQRVLMDQNMTVQSSLAKTIILSSLQKINQKLSSTFRQKWRNIFDRTRKLMYNIQNFLEGKPYVRKEELVEVIDKGSRQRVGLEEYDFLTLKCFDKLHSEDEFVLDVKQVLKWMDDVMDSGNQHEERSVNEMT